MTVLIILLLILATAILCWYYNSYCNTLLHWFKYNDEYMKITLDEPKVISVTTPQQIIEVSAYGQLFIINAVAGKYLLEKKMIKDKNAVVATRVG